MHAHVYAEVHIACELELEQKIFLLVCDLYVKCSYHVHDRLNYKVMSYNMLVFQLTTLIYM